VMDWRGPLSWRDGSRGRRRGWWRGCRGVRLGGRWSDSRRRWWIGSSDVRSSDPGESSEVYRSEVDLHIQDLDASMRHRIWLDTPGSDRMKIDESTQQPSVRNKSVLSTLQAIKIIPRQQVMTCPAQDSTAIDQSLNHALWSCGLAQVESCPPYPTAISILSSDSLMTDSRRKSAP